MLHNVQVICTQHHAQFQSARPATGFGARWLAVEAAHCREVAVLPWHHRDPFDRLLVAQEMCEDMTLISRDRVLTGYPTPVLW